MSNLSQADSNRLIRVKQAKTKSKRVKWGQTESLGVKPSQTGPKRVNWGLTGPKVVVRGQMGSNMGQTEYMVIRVPMGLKKVKYC